MNKYFPATRKDCVSPSFLCIMEKTLIFHLSNIITDKI